MLTETVSVGNTPSRLCSEDSKWCQCQRRRRIPFKLKQAF
jgi:hypothetical protein